MEREMNDVSIDRQQSYLNCENQTPLKQTPGLKDVYVKLKSL